MMWAAAAIVVILAVASSAAVFQPVQAWAATPPLLSATPVTGTATELLNQLADAAAATGDPTPTGDVHIAVQAWTLDMEYDSKIVSTRVVPEEYSISRRADGSFTSVITAGAALGYGDGGAASSDTPTAGTVLARVENGPGEYVPLFPRPFPTNTAQIGPYFTSLFGPGAAIDADTIFLNFPLVLMEQVLGGQARAAVLQYLATLPGIDVVGAVTDRLGRAGIMFRTARTGDPDALDYLVIAPADGRILAAETHYVGHDRTDIRSPSVTSYYAWK